MSIEEEYSKSNKKIMELAENKLIKVRAAKQIFEEELSGEPLTQESVIESIKQAQLEAIEETVKLCAEKAETISFKKSQFGKYRKWQNIKEGEEVDLFSYHFMTKVNKQSILNCEEILKKEIL